MLFKKRRASSIAKPVVIEDISTHLIPITGCKPFAVVLHNLLTPDECANLIRRVEDEGFDDALVQGPDGKQILRQDIRSCGRCIIDDVGLADALYIRIFNALRGTELEKKIMHAPWVAAKAKKSTGRKISDDCSSVESVESSITAVGLNERMRFLKYDPGHFFAPHNDLRYVRGPDCGEKAGETSHITVQLYLNEKFKGGSTRFLGGKRYYDVKPKIGSVLLFDHDLLHQGSRVLGGIKYSVRTDIMFTPLRRSLSRSVTPEDISRNKKTSEKLGNVMTP
mmetsp:Transcript_31008/g.52997  ORF Transcript_31008/g.52997 Transcript_31008/m.52997 type:complete len:280 (+) Transcript_31008:117-956(+)|eukprot:CAMPEP_0183733068 /NCGR_PEP_ID=MMETSP0737-20130205/40076_1 /TAXON_ID=385413 /ORGANISM="Thalassiosira miniscula, Strain CCMP1093" /LENGTH=279 /DNA_ID=CAMNT_0025966241 /DNA_START=269 /DNA_END=1108 /DNA_ORIENTATION=+